jgi:hypothetical protein
MMAQAMNSETFLCKIGNFLQDSGLVRVPKEDVAACKMALLEANLLGYREGVYNWVAYRMPPSKQDEVEGKSSSILSRLWTPSLHTLTQCQRGATNLFSSSLQIPTSPQALRCNNLDICGRQKEVEMLHFFPLRNEQQFI